MTTVFRRHPNLLMTSLDGEGVVLHLGARKYFTVNETGLTILEALESPKTFEEVVTALVNEYHVERPQAVASARAFVDQCLAADVINQETR